MSPSGGSNKKVANGLVALSAAAVLAVYSAGFVRTRSAANRFEVLAAERRPANSGLPAGPETSPASSTDTRNSSEAKPERGVAPAVPPSSLEPSPKPAPVAGPMVIQDEATVTAGLPAADLVAPPPVADAASVTPVTEAKAPNPPTANVATPAPAKNVWKDGTYYGWGTSRHGNIEAAVLIEGGRIASATISQCRTRYSCNVIEKLPPQVAQRQSPEVDYVSGATQSTNAFYYAVVEALSQAK